MWGCECGGYGERAVGNGGVGGKTTARNCDVLRTKGDRTNAMSKDEKGGKFKKPEIKMNRSDTNNREHPTRRPTLVTTKKE